MKTSALPKAGSSDLSLNGSKTFITNGAMADVGKNGERYGTFNDKRLQWLCAPRRILLQKEAKAFLWFWWSREWKGSPEAKSSTSSDSRSGETNSMLLVFLMVVGFLGSRHFRAVFWRRSHSERKHFGRAEQWLCAADERAASGTSADRRHERGSFRSGLWGKKSRNQNCFFILFLQWTREYMHNRVAFGAPLIKQQLLRHRMVLFLLGCFFLLIFCHAGQA